MSSKSIFILLLFLLCLANTICSQKAIQFSAVSDPDKSYPEVEKLGWVYIEKIPNKNLYRYKLVPIYSFNWGLEILNTLGFYDAFITDHPPSGTRHRTRLAEDDNCKCLDLDIVANPVCLDNYKRLDQYNVEIARSGYCYYYLKESKLSKRLKINLNRVLVDPVKNKLMYHFRIPDIEESNYIYDSSTFDTDKGGNPFIVDYYLFNLTAKSKGEWLYSKDEFLVRVYDNKYIYGDIVRTKDLD